MRSAIRQQRAAKQPGDGLLYRPPCDDGSTEAGNGSSQSVADRLSACDVEVSISTVTQRQSPNLPACHSDSLKQPMA